MRLPAKDDICYATQNRQTAVKELARQSDLVLVIGSPTSSNANRLVEVARNAGTPARLIEDADDIDPAWLDDVRAVGLTAGASTPEVARAGGHRAPARPRLRARARPHHRRGARHLPAAARAARHGAARR